MNGRVIVAGLVAGIGMYVWSALAHTALPLGEAGIQQIPNEQTILTPMQSTLGSTSGMYVFPAMGTGTASEKMATYEKKLATMPNGVLIYHPVGGAAMTARPFIVEFLTELAEAMLAVFLLSMVRLESFAARVGFVAVIGVIAAIATNISYWNWYGFPVSYTLAYIVTQLVGFLVAGLIGAAMLRAAPRATVAAAR
ncbi:MAG TPA: hypothetical protein VHB50_12980 [Bryobacteraceae bacterium]|nr:hypothetical protein [Bryobacteraceae bacterium]